MKKKIVSMAAVAGLSVASLAGAADVTIFGASAQFDFLNATAVSFVKKYCTTAVPASGNGNSFQYKTADGNTIKHGIVTGSTCTSVPGGGTTLSIRYSGIASGEGLQAINKAAPLDAQLTDGCSNGQRRIAPLTGPYANIADGNLAAYKAATVCATINIGTSDVAYDQFSQTYDNSLVDPSGTNTTVPLPVFAQPSATDNKTLAVPFAFYVNPGVTATHCIDNTTDKKKTGGYCTSGNTEQCSTGSVCESTPSTIDNLSRLQANILYSGQITNWNQLGGYFTSNPVKLCLRKPGSGTMVGFEKTVMLAGGNSGWGAAYTNLVNNDISIGLPYTYFGGSSTDMKNCLGGLDNFKDPNNAVVPFTGAIGYMDADTANLAGVNGYTKVKYNGVSANRTNVRNGAYEFYTIGHMYADSNPLSSAVAAFVSDPASIDLISGKKAFWAAATEMNFLRGADTEYPAKGTPTANPQPTP